jgi:hypothetical protein
MTEKRVISSIRKLDCTLLFITHRPAAATVATYGDAAPRASVRNMAYLRRPSVLDNPVPQQ